MATYKCYYQNKDHVVDELLAALLLRPSYGFHELFQVVYARLKARKLKNIPEDNVRLRLYEKLHGLVAEGLVDKREKRYAAVQDALRERVEHMATSRAFQLERKQALGCTLSPASAAERLGD
jgi:hypothetical protein